MVSSIKTKSTNKKFDPIKDKEKRDQLEKERLEGEKDRAAIERLFSGVPAKYEKVKQEDSPAKHEAIKARDAGILFPQTIN